MLRKASIMANMASGEIERLLNEVGNVLAQDTDYPLEGTFLYVEAESMMVDMSIKDLGDAILFRLSMRALSGVLLDLWEAADPKKRWATMEYRIVGGKFTASFTYPEDIDPNESTMDRRERIMQQRYGNKRSSIRRSNKTRTESICGRVKQKGGAVAPPLFGAVELLVNSWPRSPSDNLSLY
jgi:hypothetical protein